MQLKHKKTVGFLSIFFLLIIGFFVFFDPILKTVANSVLRDLDPPLKSEIGEVDSDLIEGKLSFALSSLPKEDDPKLLQIQKISLDADLDFEVAVALKGVRVQLDQQSLQKFQRGESSGDKESDDSLIPGPVKFLSSFELKDFSLKLLDADLDLRLSELLLDFEEGSGVLHGLTGIRSKDSFTFIDLPVIGLGFAEDLVDAEKKDLAIQIPAPKFAVDQSLIDSVFKYLPQKRQAQEAEEPEAAPINPARLIDEVVITDLEAKAIGEKGDLFFALGKFDLDFDREALNLEDLNLLLGSAPALLSLDRLRVEFSSEELLTPEPRLGIQLNGTKVHVKKESTQVLAGLPRPPERPESSDDSKILEKLSYLALADSEITYAPMGILAGLETFLLDARAGDVKLTGLKGQLEDEKKPFFRLKTLTSIFDPAEMGGAKTPSVEVTVNGVHADVSKKLLNSLKPPETKKKSSERKPLPVEISRVLVGETSVDFLDFPGVGDQEHLQIRNIVGSINNITLAPGTPLADFAFNGTFEGESKFMVNGKFDLAGDPPEWSLNYRLFDLDMTKLNDELRARVPLTFNDGVLNFYGEAISKDNRIVGYYKPVLDDGDYLGNENEFKGIKHFLIETATTVASWLFERDETDTLATRIPFEIKDGKLDPDVSKAVWNAVEHGFLETDRIEPGVEHKYQLKQAQEAE